MEVIASGDKVNKKIGAPEALPEDDLAGTGTKTSPSKPNTSNTTSNSTLYKPTTSNGNANQVTLNQSLQDQLTHPISSLTPYQNKYRFLFNVNKLKFIN